MKYEIYVWRKKYSCYIPTSFRRFKTLKKAKKEIKDFYSKEKAIIVGVI